jgi:hypothetical protein
MNNFTSPEFIALLPFLAVMAFVEVYIIHQKIKSYL